jgi:hypothetical protein
MGGFVVEQDSQPEGPPRRVHPEKLLEMFQSKILPWPELSDDDINDKSKADWTMKSLAIIQILWFATQMIGRWVHGIGTTTLELFTLGIVFSAVVIYVSHWEKPFDVQMPVVIHVKDSLCIREDDCISRVSGLGLASFGIKWSWPAEIAICCSACCGLEFSFPIFHRTAAMEG